MTSIKTLINKERRILIKNVKDIVKRFNYTEAQAEAYLKSELETFEETYSLTSDVGKKIVKYVNSVDNATLFQDVLDASVPDDYDGCFSSGAWREFVLYTLALKVRLINSGFLEQK